MARPRVADRGPLFRCEGNLAWEQGCCGISGADLGPIREYAAADKTLPQGPGQFLVPVRVWRTRAPELGADERHPPLISVILVAASMTITGRSDGMLSL